MSVPSLELGSIESKALVTLCQNNRLAPILGHEVQSGRLVLSEESLAELATTIEHYLATQLRVECGAMPVIDALIQHEIEFRVMKGMATAFLDYPNPAMRPIGDLDLLIRPRDMPRAIEALAALEGGELHVLPGNDWRITHAIPLRLNGVEVDLHSRLLHQAAGHCAARLDLFADPVQYQIVGRQVMALPAWLRLILASAQNVLGGYPQVSSDLDVARLAEHARIAMERSAQVGLGWVVTEGIRGSQRNLGWTSQELAPPRSNWRDHWFERAYGRQSASILEQTAIEIVMAPPSIGAALVKTAVLPGEDYLERRGRSPRQQIIRQLRRLRPKRPR